MSNWSEIPEDLIDAIVNRLHVVEDFVRSGAVCRSWRSVTIAHKELFRSFAPWLLLPEKENEKKENEDKAWRICFSISSQKKFRIELPEAEGRRCLGSGNGWLMTIGLDLNINLLNPLSRVQISLPSQPTLKDGHPNVRPPQKIRKMYIQNFAVSSTPSVSSSNQQNLIVMVVYGGGSFLAFASPGDETWTTIQGTRGGFGDVIYFDGHFYAVCGGRLSLCEIDTPTPKLTLLASPPPDVEDVDRFFLVEMSGHLHLVDRIIEPDMIGIYHYDTVGFEVYRFDFHSKQWTELFDMGDYALFVGTNSSFSISTSQCSGVKPNSIYFTDDHLECYGRGFCDMGVHDFKDETFKPFYFGDDVHSTFCTPLLFMPAL